MTSKSRLSKLWNSLRDKEYRDAFVEESVSSGVAAQIRENRAARGLTQKQLGELAEMSQVRISKLERFDGGTPNLSTLLRIASALDCALSVRFVPFSELAGWSIDVSGHTACVSSFSDDSPRAAEFDPHWATSAFTAPPEQPSVARTPRPDFVKTYYTDTATTMPQRTIAPTTGH